MSRVMRPSVHHVGKTEAKVIVVAIVILLCFVCSDESTASSTRATVVLFKAGSIRVPTRVKRPRHQRFLSEPLRSVPPVESLSREVSGIFVPLLLLSGDVELNPGPSDQQVNCICLSIKEQGHMLQCEQCLKWCHT